MKEKKEKKVEKKKNGGEDTHTINKLTAEDAQKCKHK